MRGRPSFMIGDSFDLFDTPARMYSPSLGRYLTPDPELARIGRALGHDRYSHALNDPNTYVDPDGRIPFPFFALLLGLALLKHDADGGDNGAFMAVVGGGLAGEIFPLLARVPGAILRSGATAGAAEAGVLKGANFAQKTFGPMFSKGGAFAGRSVEEVAAALRSGAMNASDVTINYIVRDGNTLILNTRSAQALEAAGIPRSAWSAVNRTGDELFESMLSDQLGRNGLTSAGTATVRQSGL
jgi:RHS repeat-associated protein